MNEMTRIALVGLPGVGKSELCQRLQDEHDFFVFDSSWLRSLYKAATGRDQQTRHEMVDFVKIQKNTRGPDFIYRQAVAQARAAGVSRLVIDGIRDPDDFTSFQADGGLAVGVYARPDQAYHRLKERGRQEDNISLEEFIQQRENEMTGLGIVCVGKLLTQVDVKVLNPDYEDYADRERHLSGLASNLIHFAETIKG